MFAFNKAESARINSAKSICLTNEDHGKFKELLQDHLELFQPTNNIELRLIDQMASGNFRLERFASTETALFDLEMDTQASQIENDFEQIDHPTRFAMAFKSLADNSKSLRLYLRYEATITGQYARALKQLLALRANFPISAESKVPNESSLTRARKKRNGPEQPGE